MYLEVTWPLGLRQVVSLDAYLSMPHPALSATRARLLTRTEVLRWRAQEMRK